MLRTLDELCEVLTLSQTKKLDLFRFVNSPTGARSLLQDGLRTELHGTAPAFARSITAKNPQE